ncbi:MAG: trypsin-like peptidase domain-containing protein [Actinomycetia bacterium]|nr:trypsin-like peptidase domain-containing protein [Actinomycetes bacterium]
MLVTAVIAALIGAFAAAGLTLLVTKRSDTRTIFSSAPITPTQGGTTIKVKGESTSLSEVVAQKALPSVVSISVSAPAQGNPFTGQGSGSLTQQDSGSGVIIKSDGYIITNNHVISGGTKIEVNAGGKNYTAKVVGADPGTDIAVLKIDAKDLPAIQIGTSNDLRVGQYVMAIGCPFGLEKSVSTGIISGLGRSDLMATNTYVTAYTNLIQTDAAINPGNSGGALVDQNAHLIGINALINSTSGSSAGVGFAIPIDTAIDIANQLMTTGKVVHPFLGVSTQTITSDVAAAYNMPVKEGAFIIAVSSGSPAAAAGLKANDIITEIDGTKITSSDDVFKAVRASKVGAEIKITYYRGTSKHTTTAKLAADNTQQQQQQQGSTGGSSTDPHSGYTPQELRDLLQNGLGGN